MLPVCFFPNPFPSQTVLQDTLVQAVEKVRTVFIAEQQIKLIRKDPCRFSLLPVLDHTVKIRIQCDQHAKGISCFAQLPDVIVDDTALRVDIGFLGKGVQTAIDKTVPKTEPALWLLLPAGA